MKRTLTPDQFALAWERVDGDRIPYPLAVRLSAADNVARAAQLPALHRWCDEHLDADLEAALRVLARPVLRAEVFGYGPAGHALPRPVRDEPAGVLRAAPGARQGHDGDPDAGAAPGPPVRVLGALAGDIAVVAAQSPGTAPDRGGDIRIGVGRARTLAAGVVAPLPRNDAGTLDRLTAPLARVAEDSRDLVTVPVSGPSVPARIRRLLRAPRDGIGQIVVSVRRDGAALTPFGVLCWIDVAGDGRYAVRTGAEVDITPVSADGFAAQLRPMLAAAGRVAPRVAW